MGWYGKYKNKRAYKRAVGKSHAKALAPFKKRYGSGSKWNIAKIASDARSALYIAKTAQGLLNTEKKRCEFNSYNQTIGQVNGNLSGDWSREITPIISQGTGFGTRQGSSISLRSYYMKLQLYGMSSFTSPVLIKFYVVQTKTADAFDMTTFSQWNKYLYALNSTAIYDTHCERDPDYLGDYKILMTKSVYMPAKINNTPNKDVTIKLNFGRNGKHIRFNDNTNDPTHTRLYLVAVASSGNRSGTTTSTLQGIQNTAVNSGVYLQLDGVAYFIDN